jgi:hypothetical protein
MKEQALKNSMLYGMLFGVLGAIAGCFAGGLMTAIPTPSQDEIAAYCKQVQAANCTDSYLLWWPPVSGCNFQGNRNCDSESELAWYAASFQDYEKARSKIFSSTIAVCAALGVGVGMFIGCLIYREEQRQAENRPDRERLLPEQQENRLLGVNLAAILPGRTAHAHQSPRADNLAQVGPRVI